MLRVLKEGLNLDKYRPIAKWELRNALKGGHFSALYSWRSETDNVRTQRILC